MDEDNVTPIRPEPEGLTLADITVTWKDGDQVRTLTGRQIAHLITVAAVDSPEDSSIGCGADATGQWTYKLRGLSYLVFPDAGVPVHEDDARAFVSSLLQQAAAEIAADALNYEDRPKRFRVVVAPAPTSDGASA